MSAGLSFTDYEWIRIEQEASARSLSEFVKLAWHVLEPGAPYIHGWHIDAISEHLEAVSAGQINRLLINCPPGVMKSLLVGVFWPMWEWGPRNLQPNRYLAASHSADFANRDNLRARRLVQSDWFQKRWPVLLQDDQDTKKKFENRQTGWRASTAMGSMTGERADRVIIDDPHSVENAVSDADRETAIRIFQETVPTRMNSPEKSSIIVIMQRLHQRDVSGFILEQDYGYDHLMLPMEFEPKRKCVTSLGFEDPRKEEGELLFPERFPAEVVERDKKIMGPIATAGQLQQRPAPRGGAMIPVAHFKYGVPPKKLYNLTRYWDKAGTQDGGKRTAGVLMGKDEDRRIWILHVKKGQWGTTQRELEIKQQTLLDGPRVQVWVEQEPGSGGKESAENTIKNLMGYIVHAERPTGDKALRAEPFASQVQAENVFLPVGAEWVQEYVDEAELFPLGRFKDQIDATSGAFNKINEDKSTIEAMAKYGRAS